MWPGLGLPALSLARPGPAPMKCLPVQARARPGEEAEAHLISKLPLEGVGAFGSFSYNLHERHC